MNWASLLPWVFTLLCPLSMLWCMWGMRRGGAACHGTSAPAAVDGAGTGEIEELRRRIAELESRQAEPVIAGRAATDGRWREEL